MVARFASKSQCILPRVLGSKALGRTSSARIFQSFRSRRFCQTWSFSSTNFFAIASRCCSAAVGTEVEAAKPDVLDETRRSAAKPRFRAAANLLLTINSDGITQKYAVPQFSRGFHPKMPQHACGAARFPRNGKV